MGIAGKLSFDAHRQIAPATVQRMVEAVAYRGGPTGGRQLSYIGHGIALGAFSEAPLAAAQVARNESGTVRAVADAALSNRASLRSMLRDRGHVIESTADAELIAHAYEEWGDGCLERLSGPFACAVWDEVEHRLLLARDHFGIRPLCFAILHGDGLVFASEIKALLQDPSVGAEWHPDAIDAYLTLGYVPAPMTMHGRISKLEPAHALIVEGRLLATRRYWDPVSLASESIDLLESGLRLSVASATGDREARILTSGGLASTTIAAMAPREVLCLGIDDGAPGGERVSRVAAHLGLRSQIEPSQIDATTVASLLVWQLDEPIADPAAVSQLGVFTAARRHTANAVTGHGAAVFCGSPRARVLFQEPLRDSLFTRRFWRRLSEGGSPRAWRQSAAEWAWLADAHLAIADRVSGAAGLRLAYPFLNRSLADLVFAPAAHLEKPQAQTCVLRQIAARHLPPELLSGHGKAADAPAWLSRAVAALVPEVLLGERLDTRGIFSRPAIQDLWDEHRDGRHDHARRLWALLMLELWFREFIDGDASERPAGQSVLVRAA